MRVVWKIWKIRRHRGTACTVLEPLPASEETSVFEHVSAHRMQRPVRPLSWPVWAARDFDEAIVEGEIVSEGVLPPLRVLPVEGEVVHDVFVDVIERKHLLAGALDGHCGERDV